MGGVAQYPGLENQSLAGEEPHRVLDANHMYDPATNTWQPRQTMPTARNHMFVGAVSGKIYVIGGRVGSMAVATGSTTDLVEEYDVAAAVRLAVGRTRRFGVRHVGDGDLDARPFGGEGARACVDGCVQCGHD